MDNLKRILELNASLNRLLEEEEMRLKSFQVLFDSINDFICIAGTDGYFKTINPMFVKHLGFTKEELLTQPFITFIHPDDLEPTHTVVKKLSELIPTVKFVNRYKTKDGKYIPIEWNATSDDKGVIYAIGR